VVTAGARHHTTWDGTTFLFNGIGEYSLFSADSGSEYINVQARSIVATGDGKANNCQLSRLNEFV